MKNTHMNKEKYWSFIKKQENLFIVNGDRHWQYVTNIVGTNLWEFGCGAGTDSHSLTGG